MLRLVRSVKNTFAAINQIPPEVFSLIPDYWQDRHTGQDLITLSHVCRGWREIFTSRSSLWTYLDCADADKTRVYVERSRSLPLEIFLRKSQRISYCDDALPLVVPHISRLSSLTVCVRPNILLDLLNQLPFPAPLLTELKIVLDPESPDPDPIIPDTFPRTPLTVAQAKPVRCFYAPTLEESIKSHHVRVSLHPADGGSTVRNATPRLLREYPSSQQNFTP